MITPLDKLSEHEFSLSGINLIRQKPIYHYLNVKNRRCNGFLFCTKGECVYEFDNKKIAFAPGAVIYLPYGSKHCLKVVSEHVEFFRVDFTIKIKGEIVLFSNRPTKITDAFSKDCLEILDQLENLCLYSNDNVLKMQKLLSLFDCLRNNSQANKKGKIYSASVYISEHFAEPLDCNHLAKLCFLSTSQFYNLFNKQFNMTPLQYRDNLIIKKAKVLLKLEEITISEISEILGFTDVAYFSRFFKKHVGISPSIYAKKDK
ncbi:MAG: helix-turn-helix transcriptional regulator [Clostridia bacterium]|nr:helix-turn-helix transcriptional regulator [Clostridia bacterium]